MVGSLITAHHLCLRKYVGLANDLEAMCLLTSLFWEIDLCSYIV